MHVHVANSSADRDGMPSVINCKGPWRIDFDCSISHRANLALACMRRRVGQRVYTRLDACGLAPRVYEQRSYSYKRPFVSQFNARRDPRISALVS
jgi:hypothetical protein